jgi:hypothetical protein
VKNLLAKTPAQPSGKIEFASRAVTEAGLPTKKTSPLGNRAHRPELELSKPAMRKLINIPNNTRYYKKYNVYCLMFKLMSVALLAAIGWFPSVSPAQTVITLLPYVIRAPGLYVLNKSLTYDSPGFAAIAVNSENVTIDLQGFSISRDASGKFSSIGIFGVNVANVTVRNGSIIGFAEGIKFQSQGGHDVTSELIENIRFDHIKNTAVYLLESRNSIVRNCQIASTGFDSDNAVIPEALGIGINDMNSIGGNQLIANNISEAKQTGIVLGANDLADGNFITKTPSGIRCIDISSKFKNNTVSQCPVPYTGGTQLPGTNF